MVATRSSTDKAVDEAVARLMAASGAPRPEDEVPMELRTSSPDSEGLVNWTIRRIQGAPWIDDLEARLPRPFPPSFRSLVLRYAFPSFEVGPVMLFANTGDLSRDDELAVRVFLDPHLSEVLLKNGYVQLGWRGGTGYDPVCFDTNQRRGGGECPIVRLDHECAVIDGEADVEERIADSFLDLIGNPTSGLVSPRSR